jgi:hypothetical protein
MALTVEALKGKRLVICTPAYQSRVHISYAMSMMRTQAFMASHAVEMGVQFLSGSARITYARNELIRAFMGGDGDWMLMVDSDIGWEHEAPMRMMMHDVPFVAGTTVKRGTEDMCYRPPNVMDTGLRYDATGRLLSVGAVGTGFIMLRRDMIVAMERAYPNLGIEDERSGHPKFGLFSEMLTPEGNDEGEDYSFCSRWRAIGGDVWLDPWIALSHVSENMHTSILGSILNLEKPGPMGEVEPLQVAAE